MVPKITVGNSAVILGLFSFNFVFTYVCAHVALNFPQARQIDLDYLTNTNVKSPCGMPKCPIRTSIPTGMFMNFTWQMAYAHQGGYRLELLDGYYKSVANLTEGFVTGNPTAQWHVVKTPEIPCSHCVVRLIRQAREFGETYEYNSCADVDIVDRKIFRNKCYGRGIPQGSLCFCYRGYSGPLCQYKEECDSDVDCSGRGRCVHIGGSNYPSRQCFCAPGFHGEKCLLVNSAVLPTHSNLNLAMYKQHFLNDRVTLYYRMIPSSVQSLSEIEFVMEVMGTSYAALGMRPSSFNESCKLWPPIDEYATNTLSTMDISRTPIMNSDVLGINDYYFDDNNNHTNADFNAHRKTRTFILNLNFNYQRVIRPSEYAPLPGHFTPMDCTDMTIGAARGLFSRIRDYYSRDFSTPQLDEKWGGWDDITSATGWEINGKTTLIFRRKLWATDLADHCINGDMHVIWSRGQETGTYVHALPSGLEAPGETPLNKEFYTTDEIKYHGSGMQRGSLLINFST